MKQRFRLLMLATVTLLPLVSNAQTNQNTLDELAAPAYWNFDYKDQTVADAVNDVLAKVHYKVSSSVSQNMQMVMANKLPKQLNTLDNVNVYQAIKILTGAQIFSVDKANHEIYFCFNKSLSKSSKEAETAKPPLAKYLDRVDYKVRVSPILVADGLSKHPTQKEVIKFNQNHSIYFGFNDKDKIVGIAESEKSANGFAQKNISVFYAYAGQTLKETIDRWAKVAGFKSYYLAKKDFVIDVPNTFYGSLDSQNGALTQLISSATQAGVDIQAQVHANHVLVIKDNSYSPILLGGNND
ncbi:TcpQ domain-containing protein [Francisella sp. SYW-9]|uniref:TcpQ domain-containing protein n=1 Tax=Francisella sp. SYW-9 TaxID=2610888 RepID=UPI00123E2CE2|nr:TcpQ domain-containing protein [Francisella sp. SYW-9]